jgi:16S rRNA (guanine(527)-N(7))-methyltransferase RsmG
MAEKKLSPADEFDKALAARAPDFGVTLTDEGRARLRAYFELVSAWNPRLHLVAPCPPAEFATRHVLESLLALPFLEGGGTLVDVGSGAGLPAIPCLVARPDLRAVLFESSQKKSVFLREALRKVGRQELATVVARRFEETEPPAADFLTCRAIERFTEILPELLAWASGIPKLLFFGGVGLREKLVATSLPFGTMMVPGTERSFLFVVRRDLKSQI